MTDQRAPGRPRTRESRVRLHLEIDAEIAEQLDQQAAETGKPRWQRTGAGVGIPAEKKCRMEKKMY